ncbi:MULTISPECIES: O-linked GlcNAc transferase [Roseivirga]|uniref:tetratricopeptide repeat protein n=1 Tax=Roseivirga TaxID=290180 RepID=UPI00257FF59A|nr:MULTISPECIES: O-linked GlcNAc transferase [Roseivirga]MEC7754035.1 O-linked GlcNAc transferase [Bacteroidota bacterium]|tara:strand:- start:1494 stop:1991 length:498 start_codon:yes stop_codon:yes gene_type:complete
MTAYALENYILDAESAFERQEWLEGESYLLAALVEEPCFGKAHNHLGWLYLNHLRDLEKAERHLKLAMKYSPNYSAVYIHMTHFLFDAKRFEEQRNILEKAKTIPGVDFAFIYNELGRIEEVHGKSRKAVKHYKAALKWSLNDHEMQVIRTNIKRCRAKRLILLW